MKEIIPGVQSGGRRSLRGDDRAARRQLRRHLTVLYPVGECRFAPSLSVSAALGTALLGLGAPGAAAEEQLGAAFHRGARWRRKLGAWI